jgi:hypothetical protein
MMDDMLTTVPWSIGMTVRVFHLEMAVVPFCNIGGALSISLLVPAVQLICPKSSDEHGGF